VLFEIEWLVTKMAIERNMVHRKKNRILSHQIFSSLNSR
jgi:hypothetical protein